ncbi:Putative Pfs, NACHT and Ankyrin domain protein [Penicillium brasilianum]|uniref:Putative Pfs, NACHT and Ankyrin domain protein n=1 Tax=Penicillium brasilianum TaxID=104259 RepID=A0A0F7VC90_PENBI|nr:Putative Pfs, NACHT and Ankyrin domain protein [Penicillium brasilianum]
MHWLCPPDPSTNANHARTLRHEGTGAWLLENPVFQSWHSGSRRHLWLHGLAGCGKTVLSATVLDHLAKGNNRLILSFFFDFSDTTKQTLDGMLRSLAFQLYQSGVGSANHLNALFQAHQNGSDQPTTKALLDIIFKMLAAQRKVSIVLDALDESKTRDDVLLWIQDVISRPELAHVQLLYTGRPESEFLRDIPPLIGKQNCLSLDKQAVNADIRSWVTAQLFQRRYFKEKPLSEDLLERIRTKVGDGADGMFRWAFCQLDSLARCRHEAGIEEALASLPMNLDETYRRMIASIPTELKNDAIRLLQFLVHSKRPLKLAEAKEVIATQIENGTGRFDIKRRLFCETDVLDYCPGLVTVIPTADKELHLAHFSVKEYLIREDQFEITTASLSITRTCLTYLTDITGSHTDIKRDFPMARRAAEIWTGHAALAQASEDIVRVTVEFLEKEATFQRWARLYQADRNWDTEPGPPRGSRLYYACFAKLIAPAQVLISKGADVNAQGGQYGNALQAASLGGHEEVVKMLLDQGVDVNAQGGEYGNALQAASLGGHEEVVQMLLDQGADVNAQSGKFGSALQAASSKGHEKVVQRLLGRDPDVNTQCGEYGNALQAASWAGHEKIVQMLLDRGAEINAQGGNYYNALQAASWSGHEKVVQMLLDRGAVMSTEGGFFGNAFHVASWHGRDKVMQVLLDQGADINAQDGHFGNALQAASWGGHKEVVQMLLDQGVDINTQGGLYGNALQAASWRGHEEVVQLLLDRGAVISTKGGNFDNALQAASSNGHWKVMRLLLDEGSDVNAQGGEYGNALQAASWSGHEQAVQLLLEQGVDVNAQGGKFGSALQAASSKGHEKVVQMLLDQGADVNIQGGFYGNALQAASLTNRKQVAQMLRDQGAVTGQSPK